ncbi:MAG: SPFH domain-containing protein [Planctomycetia bacterium]|nr:SPFH domain-containing protein [Planctomycetia bacterium]
MFGIRYVKVPPTTYILQHRSGKTVRAGAGLSFFYFAPNTDLVRVPLATEDVPFVFNEVTADFQDATIQGELTYRIREPQQIASLLDFSVDASGRYRSSDPEKLNDRLVHAAQILARSFTQRHSLGDLLVSSSALVHEMTEGLKSCEPATMLGIEVLTLSILSIKSTPEMAKALQAGAREELLRKADEAVFVRRNAAVEMERKIRENELDTDIAVEQKKRQIREAQMEADLAVEEQKRQIREAQMAADIAVEEQKTLLVDRRVANDKKEADTRAQTLRAMLEPLKEVDWRTLMAASSGGINAKSLVAMAFRDLADNAAKIGQLNISPDLLNALLSADENR